MSERSNDDTRRVAAYIADAFASEGLQQLDVVSRLNRSKGYVSLRFAGKASFTISELSEIAKMIHLRGAFDLMAEADKHSRR